MSDTMTATTDQWMQFYQQTPDDPQVWAMDGLISDTNTIVTTTTSSSSSPSPTSPKAINNGSKPIRRRSRASKRTPTTLLNANTTNFRALVQQFTGRPSNPAMSFEVYKGPITLNFQQGKRQVHHNTSRTVAPTPFENVSYGSKVHQHHRHHHHHQQLPELAVHQQQWRQDHHQQQQQQQQQQSGDNNLFDYSTDFFQSLINSSAKPTMEISDGLIVDHSYSLNDLTMNNAFFSNDMIQNNSYFM